MPAQSAALLEVDAERKADEEANEGNHEEPDDGEHDSRAVIDWRGTPASRRRRPGTSTFTTCAPPINSVATASTAHPVAEPTTSAHTTIAAHASSAPGSTGTTTPTIPVAIARATTTSPRSLTAQRWSLARDDFSGVDRGCAAAEEPQCLGVLRNADAGQDGDLLATGREHGDCRRSATPRDAGAAGGEEVADLLLRLHVPSVDPAVVGSGVALGVSGGSLEQDQEVAEAGVAVFVDEDRDVHPCGPRPHDDYRPAPGPGVDSTARRLRVPDSLTDLAGLTVGAEDFLAAVLETAAQPIWVVDPDGVIRFANPAAIAALGYDSADELFGRNSHETIHYRHPDGTPYPAAECPMLLPRATGETVASDLDWFFRRDGSMFPVSYVSAPIELPEGRGAVVAFTDIEDRLRAERGAARARGGPRGARGVAAADRDAGGRRGGVAGGVRRDRAGGRRRCWAWRWW